jgi:predicted nuclease of restriction endonuclease-like (RecB) superfamily
MKDKTPDGTAVNGYGNLLGDIKERIRSAQYAALRAVNMELIGLYWDIGRMIVERQAREKWGKAVVDRLAQDLQKEFPGIRGFSASNLWRMRSFVRRNCQNDNYRGLLSSSCMERQHIRH